VFYDTLFELVKENVDENTLVIIANHRTKLDVGKACMAAAEKYGFPYSDLSFFIADNSHNNPYYAFKQYPDYTGTTEFRTHPGDLGHDALGKGIFETAKEYVPVVMKPRYIYLPEALDIVGAGSVNAQSTYTVKVTQPDSASDVTWSVDNENVATISNDGVLTPVNNGTVTITAKSNYNDVSTSKTVTVTGQTACYTVTYLAGTTDEVTGLPESFEITSTEVYEAIKDVVDTICNAIREVLNKTDPDLVADIMNDGMYLAGGGSKLLGFPQRIEAGRSSGGGFCIWKSGCKGYE
jgi:hypothetical protein